MVSHLEEGFFKTTTRLYGYDNTVLLKSWIKINITLCTALQQLTFLIRCRRHDILPPHIYNLKFNVSFNSNNVNRHFKFFNSKYQSKMLNLEIKDINSHLNFLRAKIREIEIQLYLSLPENFITDFFERNIKVISRHNSSTKLKLMNKFNHILSKRNQLGNVFFNKNLSKWIVNVSNKQIPDSILNFLSLGDKFGLPINCTDRNDRVESVLHVIKNFELNSQKISEKSVIDTRTSISNVLQRFLTNKKHINHIDRLISDSFDKCRQFLKHNDDILVTKADKGHVTVVMDRNAYNNQMTDLLNDQTTYKKLNKDPFKRIQTRLNGLIRSWFDSGIIDEYTHGKLRSTCGNLPRCYGLPKVHKNGFPLRIIVSTMGSPLYNIASFLHDILHKSIPKPASHIKDSWCFVKRIQNVKIRPDEILISLDATSLFTNIPKDLVMKAIEKRWSHISTETKLNLQQFLYAIDMVLSSTSFCFNGQIYDQIFGSPMGSPLSPILADMVLDDLETHCLEILGLSTSIFGRYVDDIFAIIPRNMLDDTLNVFNSYHPRLKFTCETETNNSINFLDTTVIREGEILLTNWYRKPTFSGRYINYHSSHPLNYKISVVKNLVNRAILLSDKRFHDSNIKIVHEILSDNCYPTDFINQHIKRRLKDIKYNDTNNKVRIERNPITIPYIKDVSEGVCNVLRSKGFDVIYTVPKKLDRIIKRGKDILDNNRKTEVVYKIDCANCDACYIGQTKRNLETRLKEHIANIKKHPDYHSVVSKHKVSLNHDFDWANPKILHKEKHFKKREIAEMVFIKKENNSINLQKDTDNLSELYDKIINSL